jgi:hypothetical protein
VLVEEMLHFKRRAMHTVRIPAGKAQGVTPIRPPSAAVIFGYKEDDSFEDSPGRDTAFAREEL